MITKDNIVHFEEDRIKYYNALWNSLKLVYHQNRFFSSLHSQMNDKKKLTIKQWNQYKYLLTNGRSMYEAGILPKNY